MTTKQYLDDMRALYGEPGPGGEVRRLLDEACECDNAARAKRKAAGRKLAELRSKHPTDWRRLAGVNDRMAELLLDMARGRS